MSKIKIDVSGLLTEASLLDFPPVASDKTLAKSTLTHWTENSSSAVYSGYKEHALKKSGLRESLSLAQKFSEKFKTLVILGIGGSALGAKAILNALAPTKNKVIICDNLDPVDFHTAICSLNFESTCFAVISKSGGTVETVSQLGVILGLLSEKSLEIKKHIVAITDPQSGSLNKWAATYQIPTLHIPTSVGGRFSVFTPVGLFPLAFAGLDIETFLENASNEFQSPSKETWDLGQRIFDCEKGGARAHSFWPYGTGLLGVGQWFVQLWGESLGKISKTGERVGTLPIPGVGATDQHSFLQMLMEGRKNTISGFLKVGKWPSTQDSKTRVPKLPQEFESLYYLENRSFGEILNAELDATEQALKNSFRPTYRIELEELSIASLGSLMAFMMTLTSYTGALLKINPYDQPGVEAGKVILKKLLSTKKETRSL
jgi:glucose-6-phosphate isomerase